jgi:hypothetical protein
MRNEKITMNLERVKEVLDFILDEPVEDMQMYVEQLRNDVEVQLLNSDKEKLDA